MSKLDRITVTGADDSVEPGHLFELAGRYPLVEFGILYDNHPGKPRFPSHRWVAELEAMALQAGPCAPKFAAHLCGEYVPEFLSGVLSELPSHYRRIQLNTHAEPHVTYLRNLRRNLVTCAEHGVQVIFQRDGANDDLFDLVLAGRRAGLKFDVATLFDVSHGAGILPSEWPVPLPEVYCGFAGGLSPENVAGQIAKLEVVCSDATVRSYWIDAETYLRSFDEKKFDLGRVERFLAVASAWPAAT